MRRKHRGDDDVSGITKRRLRITRDGILFTAGLLGVVYETVVSKTDRPTLLLLFAAMMGLPAFLNKDEKEQSKNGDAHEEDKDGRRHRH